MSFSLEPVDALPSTEGRGRPADPAEVQMVEQIKAQPGQWFKIMETDKPNVAGNTAGNINKGRRKAFRDSGIVAKSRKLPTQIQQGTGEETPRYAVFVQLPNSDA